MSLPHETMLELMQYADGELPGDARARVEELLRTNEEARGVVDAMGSLGEVVREGVEERAEKSGAADGIADGVMVALERSAKANEPTGPGTRVVVPVVRVEEARRTRRGRTSAVVVALALAAGVLLFVTSKAPAPVAREEPVPSASIAPAATQEPAPPAAVAQADAPGVDLEEVRSIRNKVNVFFVQPPEAEGATASVVIWIDDRHGGH